MMSMEFYTFEMKFRGGAKSFKFGWVFLIPVREYQHYEQQSAIVLL